jgi:hypothetical protein
MKSTTAAKQKVITLADLVADSELKQKIVQIGDHSVTVRELTGRERYELTERTDDNRWDTMLFLAKTGLVEPEIETPEDLDAIRTEWVTLIANAILSISGMETDDNEEAENESAGEIDIGGS